LELTNAAGVALKTRQDRAGFQLQVPT